MSQLPLDQQYPNTVTPRQQDSSGSFGPVFAVLAVIVVVSAVACVLGRLCSKRKHRTGTVKEATNKAGGGKQSSMPKEWQKPKFIKDVGNIDYGFDKKAPPCPKNAAQKPKHKPEFIFSDNV